MPLNIPVVIIVIIGAFALLIWMVRRDQKDKHRFERKLINDETKSDQEKKNHGGTPRL